MKDPYWLADAKFWVNQEPRKASGWLQNYLSGSADEILDDTKLFSVYLIEDFSRRHLSHWREALAEKDINIYRYFGLIGHPL